ncbi:MAG: type II secretion system GspH family protein [Polyangiaceae bacterium]|nr:type II secretion system GspH family protein [Polyangiaceae bacterium]
MPSSLPPPAPGALRVARRRGQRGFTILEVMAALLVASILAAAALPTMSGRMSDRRTQQFAQQIGLFYREARTRAMGRGASHLVRFSTAQNPRGRLDMFEAVQAVGGAGNTGNCANLPLLGVNTCEAVAWGTSANSRPISALTEPSSGNASLSFAQFLFNGAAQADVDVCYSPGGRAYLRPSQSGPFTAFNGVQQIEVTRKVGGNPADLLRRQVFLLPSGSTRVETVVLP